MTAAVILHSPQAPLYYLMQPLRVHRLELMSLCAGWWTPTSQRHGILHQAATRVWRVCMAWPRSPALSSWPSSPGWSCHEPWMLPEPACTAVLWRNTRAELSSFMNSSTMLQLNSMISAYCADMHAILGAPTARGGGSSRRMDAS